MTIAGRAGRVGASQDIIHSNPHHLKMAAVAEGIVDKCGDETHPLLVPVSSPASILCLVPTGSPRVFPPTFRVMSVQPPHGHEHGNKQEHEHGQQSRHVSEIGGCQGEDIVGYVYLSSVSADGKDELRKVRITVIVCTRIEDSLYDDSVKENLHEDGTEASLPDCRSKSRFLSLCKKYDFQSVLTCSVYNSDRTRVKSFSLSTSYLPQHPLSSLSSSSSECISELHILVTGADRTASQREGIGGYEGAVSDLRILDGHTLRTLAVLSVSRSGPSGPSGGIQPRRDDEGDSLETERTREHQGQGVEAKLEINSPAVTLTAVSLVSSNFMPDPLLNPFSLSLSSRSDRCLVALTTECSTPENPSPLSNKLLLWQPHLHATSDLQRNARSSHIGEGYDSWCRGIQAMALLSPLSYPVEDVEKLLPSLLASSSEMPFNNLPTNNSTRRSSGGSKARDMLLVTSCRGQHQHVIMADPNGHIWSAVRAPQSDFPGPMYPPGFTLMQRVESYMEKEDELDNVDGVDKRKEKHPEAAEALIPTVTATTTSSLPLPLPLYIDVGVSPYFPRYNITSRSAPMRVTGDGNGFMDTDGDVERVSVSLVRVTGMAVPLFAKRLPLRLVGEARAKHLEAKSRAISHRKFLIAREKATLAATKKRNAPTTSRASKISRKRKRPKSSVKGKQLVKVRGDGERDREVEDEETVTVNEEETEALTPIDTAGEGVADSRNENENEIGSAYNNDSGIQKIRVQGEDRDSDESGADSENETDQADVKPVPDPGAVPEPISVSLPGLPPPPQLRLISISLSDVLPVPRRILTGDFAIRVQKEKEVCKQQLSLCCFRQAGEFKDALSIIFFYILTDDLFSSLTLPAGFGYCDSDVK